MANAVHYSIVDPSAMIFFDIAINKGMPVRTGVKSTLALVTRKFRAFHKYGKNNAKIATLPNTGTATRLSLWAKFLKQI